MLIRIKRVTLRDRVKSVDIRNELRLNSIQEKVREMRLRWYGHMQRMVENNEVKAIVDMIVPGKRPRGRWTDGVRWDMRELRITQEDAQDRTFGNQEFGPLTPPSGKMRRRKRRSWSEWLSRGRPQLKQSKEPLTCNECGILRQLDRLVVANILSEDGIVMWS